MTDLSYWMGIISFAGVAFLGVSTFLTNWRSGKDKVGNEVLVLYKEQVSALEADVLRARDRSNELGNQMQTLSIELGKLKGEIVARDKQLSEYKEIFQNRDPELQQVLTEIRDFMGDIHKQLITNEVRNIKIDKTTREETGKVLRNK